MLLKELSREILKDLSAVYDQAEAAYLRDILLEWATGMRRQNILMAPETPIDTEIYDKIKSAVPRLLHHEPIQYITGEAWFYRLRFLVSPAVLIPRPETEELVEKILEALKQQPALSLIDIGTGSGCIPITIKKNSQATAVTTIDVSADALNIAAQNAALHNTAINFIQQDFLDETLWNNIESFNIIVSNPPYIPESERQQMDVNVASFEPSLALFVTDERPFIFYEKITAFAQSHLKQNGKIFLETHQAYAHNVAAILEAAGFEAAVHKDISGNDRMVTAIRRL